MARPIRIEYPGATYHVMSRGVARLDTFYDDIDRREFLKRISQAVLKGVLEIHALCLMPNHYHVLASTPIAGLGRIMHSLLGAYARFFNRRHGRVGHLWQGRHKAILVEDGAYFLDCSRYIHLNPVKASLVRRAEAYPWSTYGNYWGCPTAVTCVETQKTLSCFDTNAQYIQFVESAKEQDLTSPFQRATAGAIYGGKAFVNRIRRQIKRKSDMDANDFLGLARLQATEPVPTVAEVRSEVGRVFSDLSSCQQERILVFALDQLTWLKRIEIARAVAKTPQAVSETIKTIKHRLQANDHLSRRLQNLTRNLSATPQ